MHLTVVGTGYVGLVSGAGMADFGLTVTCIDVDDDKIATLNRGEIPFYEIGLDEIIRRNVRNQRLFFSTDLRTAVEQSLVIFIAVGTPEGHDGNPDLSQVEKVVRSIADSMDDYKVIVTKSTVPLGTGKWIRQVIEQNQKNRIKFDVVSNPEFLREGSAIEDFMRPNRVVIGAESEQAVAILKDIYRPLYLIETPFVITNLETAELIKYSCNAFLATKISFINEIAALCEKTGADIHHIAKAMGLDRRIGPKFLHAGPGFGGSCFPKDVKALSKTGEKFGCRLQLVDSVLQVNDAQKQRVILKLEEVLGGLAGKQVGLLGLAFKPNTDDVRESPAVFIAQKVLEKGGQVRAYDPVAIPNARLAINHPAIEFCDSAYAVADQSDVLVIATEWNEFRNLDLERIKSLMAQPILLDTRNIFDKEKSQMLGFRYIGTGR